MIDWNWLWVAGELGISYGFYRWWKADDKFLAVLEVIAQRTEECWSSIAPDIDINDLKKFASSTHSIDYAAIHGLVRPIDSKPNSLLTSQFAAHCKGVIQRLTISERKIEKFRSIWAESDKTISDLTRHVPFRLASPTGNSVRIDRPLSFNSVEEHLDVTHVRFEANTTSAIQKIVDALLGDVSTGLETKEQMLLIDVPLTGVGRLEKRAGDVWHLVPHEQWGGILTRSSRAEVIAEYREYSSVARILCLCFGVAAGCTAAFLVYRYYSRQQRRSDRLPASPLPAETDPANVRLRCIICMENEVLYSLQPCSHLGLCHTCAEHLQARSRAEELCPICRTPIQRYQRIFLP